MARNMYGATSADFTLTSGGRVVPGATLTIWSARTGGTQITDLLDKDSVATTTVTSDADGSIVYYGPNNDKTVHWADSGVGNRIAVRPTDITGDPPVLSIGTVGTGAAAASLTGTSEAPVLNLTLPSAGANGVDTAAIQDSAVTSAKIADGTITAAQIAANAVGSSELADNAVDTAAIQDNAVTVDKIAPDAANNGLVLTSDDGEDSGMKWSAYGVADLDIGTVGTGTPAAASMTGNPEDGYELNLTLPPVGDGSISNVSINAAADIDPSKIAGTAVVESAIKQQAAGGIRADGKVHIINSTVNAVAPDLGTATILGGGSSVGANHYENVIGAATTAHVNTATSNLPVATGTEADWSVIIGGYDNVVNGWACVVAGYHNKIEATSSHCTISGGSIHSIGAGIDYATISGGTENTVTGDWAVVGGGVRNTAAQGAVAAGGTDSTASGTSSVVGGGQNNTASGIAAVVAGGVTNTASTNYSTVSGGTGNSATTGNYATVSGGTTNTASGASATVGGGGSNTASAASSTVGGGQSNVASATAATIVGGRENTAAGPAATAMGREAKAALDVMVAMGGGKFTANGDAQAIKFIARAATTDATATELKLNATARMYIDPQTTWAFSGLITARRTDADDESAGYQISGVIDRNTSGGSVALVGTPTITVLGEDSAGWDVAVTADPTYSALKITVTGEADKNIQWVAAIDIASTTG